MQQVQRARRRQEGHVSAAKHRDFQLLLCKLLPTYSANHTLPQLDGDVQERATPGAAFPGGNVIFFRYLEGRHLSPVFPSQCYSTPCFWCGPPASRHSAVKFFTHHLSLCQFISMDAPVPLKVILALSFLSRASLSWHRQSDHIVNDLHEGRCHCNKTQGQNKAEA